jgi:hypothetical protein
VSGGFLEWTSTSGGGEEGRRMAKADARPRPEWEQLPDSGQRIYLALAEGDLDRARELYQHDQRAPRPRAPRRRGGGGVKAAPAAAKQPGRGGGGVKATPAAKRRGTTGAGVKATTSRPKRRGSAGGGVKAATAAKRPGRGDGGGGVKAATAAAKRRGRDLRGFVDRDGRLVPREMAEAEAWKRRQARRDAASV